MSGRLFTPAGPAVTPTEARTRAEQHRRAQLALAIEFPRSATPAPDALAFIDAAEQLAGPWIDTEVSA